MSQDKERTWEIVQKKAFTAWVNSYLERRSLHIDDLVQDLADGVRLINFVELLSNKIIKARYTKNPTNKVQLIENTHIALTFIQNDLNIRLRGIGAEDFVDGNLKLILGFLWAMFRKFRTDSVEGGGGEGGDGEAASAKASGMLHWCKGLVQDYPGVHISDYKNSFQNGLAFLALVNKFNPELVDYAKYSAENPLANLEEAFELAEKHLHIPKLIDAQELVDKTADERSLALYLSLLYHAFASKEERERIEMEKRRAAGQLDDAASSLDQAREQRVALERKQKDLESASNTLQEDLASKNTRLEELEAVAAQVRKELAQLQEEYHATKHEKDKKTSELQHEVEHLKLALVVELNHTIETEKKNTETLKEELHETKTKLELAIESHNKGIADDSEEIKHLEHSIEEAKKQQEVEVSGFLAVKHQLDAHLGQLGRWRSVLGYGGAEFDSDTVQNKVLDKISDQPFEQQLDYLTKKLDGETAKIAALEKEKRAHAQPAK